MVTPDWADDMKNIMGGGETLSECPDIIWLQLTLTDSNDDDDHVYLMFSATFPKEARALAREYMSKDHVRIKVGRIGSTHANVTQRVSLISQSIFS